MIFFFEFYYYYFIYFIYFIILLFYYSIYYFFRGDLAILFRSQGYGQNRQADHEQGAMIKHTHSWSKHTKSKTLRLKIPRSQIRFSKICELIQEGITRETKGGVLNMHQTCAIAFFLIFYFFQLKNGE